MTPVAFGCVRKWRMTLKHEHSSFGSAVHGLKSAGSYTLDVRTHFSRRSCMYGLIRAIVTPAWKLAPDWMPGVNSGGIDSTIRAHGSGSGQWSSWWSPIILASSWWSWSWNAAKPAALVARSAKTMR